MDSPPGTNPNIEYRNPKQIQNSNVSMLKTRTAGLTNSAFSFGHLKLGTHPEGGSPKDNFELRNVNVNFSCEFNSINPQAEIRNNLAPRRRGHFLNFRHFSSF